VFFFFSNRLGFLGAIEIDIVLSALLILLVRGAAQEPVSNRMTTKSAPTVAGAPISYPDRLIYPTRGSPSFNSPNTTRAPLDLASLSRDGH
jgi:hypothetical protein